MGLRLGLILLPIFLVGFSFVSGIIEFSPQNSNTIMKNLEKTKNEIFNIRDEKKIIDGGIEQSINSEEQTNSNNDKLENVITYMKKKISPSLAVEKKPNFDANKIGYLVHKFTNDEREKHGISQLKLDGEISQIAIKHSQDMANREYFAHETPEGLNPSDRANQNGYVCQKMVGLLIYSGIAENIFQGFLFESYYTVNGEITSYNWNNEEEIAQITVEGWMNSEGHRKNILNELFDREGIGVVITEDDEVYVTQNFC